MINDDIDDDMNIDDKWLRDFKEQEKDYNDFYKEKPTSINLYFIYVNNQNVVEFFKNDKYLLNQEHIAKSDNAILQKDVLLSIIKKNISLNGRNYKLISLLKFNLDVEPEDIINMTLDKQNGSDYLSSEKEIKDIVFYDTICIFQDINSLFFVYQDRLTINDNKPQGNNDKPMQGNNDKPMQGNNNKPMQGNNNKPTQGNHKPTQCNKTHKNIKKIYLNDTSHHPTKKYTLKNNMNAITIVKI